MKKAIERLFPHANLDPAFRDLLTHHINDLASDRLAYSVSLCASVRAFREGTGAFESVQETREQIAAIDETLNACFVLLGWPAHHVRFWKARRLA